MRTKTLVLTALSSLSAIGLMAQTTNVYSLNAVGYINVTVPPGYSIISCQLIASPDNTLKTIIPAPADGSSDNNQLLKFNGSGYTTYQVDSLSTDGWDPNGNATLNPGEAAFFRNIYSTNQTLTFVGTVPQGTNSVPLNLGYNLVSSPVPQAGAVTAVLGLNVVDGSHDNDQLLTYNGGYTPYQVDSLSAGAGNSGWDPSEPTINVGQGFFYRVVTPNSATTWTRVFSVNQ